MAEKSYSRRWICRAPWAGSLPCSRWCSAVEQPAPAREALKAVKEQLRAVPGRGIGYGLLRYLTQDEGVRRRLRPERQAEVSFNYLGQFDQKRFDLGGIAGPALRIAGEPTGSAHSPQARRAHLIEINAAAAGEGLRVEWTYSPQAHRRESIEGLAESFMQELRGLIREGEVGGGDSYTPADFPLASLSQQQMKKVVGGQADVEDIYPLSPMQQDLLLYKIQLPKSQAYVGQLCCTFYGALNTSAFKRAWQAAMGRHESSHLVLLGGP